MRRLTGTFVLAALLGGCGSQDQPAPAPTASEPALASAVASPQPDLGACPKAEPVEFRVRTGPVPVPAAFARLAKSDMDHFAFTTKEGGTICVDTTWIESVADAETSQSDRFLSFSWLGYEAFGYVIVDRSGKGQVIDTGNSPVSSPRGTRFASIDLSESGFGSLNAFAVWEVRPVGLRRLAMENEDLPSGDWRIEGWQGERCVQLSLVPIDRYPEDPRDMAQAARDPWFVPEANGWYPAAGSCPRS